MHNISKKNSPYNFLQSLAESFSLDIIYAFGSRAGEVADFFAGKGSAIGKSTSDVDIGVKNISGSRLTVSQKVEIALEFEDLLDAAKVDLLVISEVDPFLAANIVRGERIYCRDSYTADEYELYILRRAGDLIPLEKERLALIMGKQI